MIQKCSCGAPIGPLFVGRSRPTKCYECRKLSEQLKAAQKLTEEPPPTPSDK